MDQERSPRMQPLTVPPPLLPEPNSIHHGVLATPASAHLRHFSLYFARIPTSDTHPTHATGIHWHSPIDATKLKFHTSFRFPGEGIQVNKVKTDQNSEHLQDTFQPLQVAVNDPPGRTVTFQASYHALTPYTSKNDDLEVIQNHW